MKQNMTLIKIILMMFPVFSFITCTSRIPENNNLIGEQLIKELAELVKTKNLSKVDVIFTDDCVYEDVPSLEKYNGKDEVKASLKEDFASVPDFKLEITSSIVTDKNAVFEWVWSGTQTGDIEGLIKATGKTFSIRGISIWEIQNGKIKRNSDYYDAGGFLYQLGVRFVFPSGKILEKTD